MAEQTNPDKPDPAEIEKAAALLLPILEGKSTHWQLNLVSGVFEELLAKRGICPHCGYPMDRCWVNGEYECFCQRDD